MTANVLGVDGGLRHAGAARITVDGRVDAWQYDSDALPEDATPFEEREREMAAVRWIVGRATRSTIAAIFEALPSQTEHGKHDARAHIVRQAQYQLGRHGIWIAEVNPVSLKHRITGDGHATKEEVRKVLDRLYPRQGIWRLPDDASDGVAAATLGVARCAAVLGPPWSGKWLDARTLNLESGFRWPRELHPTPAMRPPVQMPMFAGPETR